MPGVRHASPHVPSIGALRFMKRNLLTSLASVVLSIILLYAGGWLTYQMLMKENHNGAEWKGDLIRLFIVRELIMLPIIAAIVGVFIGWNAKHQAWWIAPLCLLPTIAIFNGYVFPSGVEMLITIIYLLIAITAAIITRYNRGGNQVVSKGHV